MLITLLFYHVHNLCIMGQKRQVNQIPHFIYLAKCIRYMHGMKMINGSRNHKL